MQNRKSDHIQLTLQSQMNLQTHDRRFIYEPLLSAHPVIDTTEFCFLGKKMCFPLWISSMTGGTSESHKINENLARACAEFGLGMGLGSCRELLKEEADWSDFNWRDVLGNECPFYANLGIAQVEQLLEKNRVNQLVDLIGKLNADGLIIHVNPLQEWFQQEGDCIQKPPIDTIECLLTNFEIPLIVKEVGQGMGYESLNRLLKLPLAAIELAAYGGTNFSKLELTRTTGKEIFAPLSRIGQTPLQMVRDMNQIVARKTEIKCSQVIISGGIKNALDGYFYTQLSSLLSVFGMASEMLYPASVSYDVLHNFIEQQIELFRLAKSFLKINQNYDE